MMLLALVLSIAVIQEYQAATTEHWMLDVAFLYWVGVSSLSLAILPVLMRYLIFSRQLIKGITAGAVK